jgi:Ca2+-binding EF-hand superfamily protein
MKKYLIFFIFAGSVLKAGNSGSSPTKGSETKVHEAVSGFLAQHRFSMTSFKTMRKRFLRVASNNDTDTAVNDLHKLLTSGIHYNFYYDVFSTVECLYINDLEVVVETGRHLQESVMRKLIREVEKQSGFFVFSDKRYIDEASLDRALSKVAQYEETPSLRVLKQELLRQKDAQMAQKRALVASMMSK